MTTYIDGIDARQFEQHIAGMIAASKARLQLHLDARDADAMKAACRADDIIARVGGDEFVILLPSTDPAFAESIIRRIKERVETVFVNGMSASVSLGLETKTDSTQNTNEIMNRAEQGMYQEKIQDAGGYRSVVIHEPPAGP